MKTLLGIAGLVGFAALGWLGFGLQSRRIEWPFRRLQTPTAVQIERSFPPAAHKALEFAPELTLFSLNLRDSRSGARFHGCKILGKTTLRGEEKTRLLAHFYDAIATNNSFGTACFTPHHGIRVQHEGKTVDFLICFGCSQMKTFGLGAEKGGTIGKSGLKFFDSVITGAGLPIERQFVG